ncbi:MAG: hypothetical protein Q8P41_05360 [Pseudomonadota bacterium]|nr:hypothetical protein [Pseudomonadota bacterium]
MLLILALATLSAPAHAAPPVPASEGPAPVVYAYRGPEASGDYTVDEVLALVRLAPAGLHEVRGPDARDWTPWNQVPTLALAWLAPQGSTVYQYSSGEGEPLRLSAQEVAERVRAAPTATHLVWKPGLPGWSDPREVPSLQLLLNGTPPPLPGTIAPPPPPAPVVVAPQPEQERVIGRYVHPAEPKSLVHVGGDVRIDFTVANLERLGGKVDGAASAGFNVSRARPILDVSLGRWFSGRLAVEVAQDDSTTTYTDTGLTFDVKDWAEGWSIQGREIYLQADLGKPDGLRQRVRVGLQEPAFGARTTYERDYPFAGEGRADLARRQGLIRAEDLGVGWHGELGARWALDVQVLNGSGGTSFDQNNGKDFVGRVEATPIEALSVSVSGLYGARGLDGSGEQAQGELTVEVRGPSQRLLVEGIVGTTTEDRLDTFYSGASASGGWTFPVDAAALDHVEVVGRFQFYDPVAGLDAPDATWSPAAGAWLGWNVGPGQVVRTGATWEMGVPQDSLLPVTHHVIGEVVWIF